jgi:hypothetical protein
MLETLEMPLRSKVIKILDETFEEVEPSGKAVVLALEVQRLTVVPRQLVDDVRYLVDRSKDPEFDLNDAKIAILAVRRTLEDMARDQDK